MDGNKPWQTLRNDKTELRIKILPKLVLNQKEELGFPV